MMERKKGVSFSILLEFDYSESSEDSDFRIEDHSDESSEEDTTNDSDSVDSEEHEDKDKECCNKEKSRANTTIVKENLNETGFQKRECEKMELPKILICCVCLSDISCDDNEIVECDNCGVAVHEGCYGISEDESVSSCSSVGSKMPWFCEACIGGQENPSCELCPNFGGILKETDTGKWVHLVCALYIPGVAFKDVDKLNNVTLFEMPYSKWGERDCSLCPDQQFARTGVCISCDAGLCRTYFHVTCAQKEGLLSEAQFNEINHADPFYAHCKLHSDKHLSKIRKRNSLTFELQMADRKKQNTSERCSDLPVSILIKNKFEKYQHKYSESKRNRTQPWVPMQSMPRPLTSSASTLRFLNRKASLSGIDTRALAMNKAHINALADVHRKWHISPAFNVEYTAYYLDRNSRISSLKKNLDMQAELKSKLVKEQKHLQVIYKQAVEDYNTEVALNKTLSSQMKSYLEFLPKEKLSKQMPKLNQVVGIKSENQNSMTYVNASLKAGSGNFLSNGKKASESPENLCLNCRTCGLANDQHLLVKCDTCHLYYHLSCLDPPLTRMPKKTKVVGWQCSDCSKSSCDSEEELVDRNIPRQLRQVKGTWRNCKSPLKVNTESRIKEEKENKSMNKVTSQVISSCISTLKSTKCNNTFKHKKQGEMNLKDLTGSANLKLEKMKQECKSMQVSLKNLPKRYLEPNGTDEAPSIISPLPLGEGNGNLQNQKLNSIDIHRPQKKLKLSEPELRCENCKQIGTKADIVTCDECLKGFHFQCLHPPVKKSPKARGYSWHCANCDPSESDSD